MAGRHRSGQRSSSAKKRSKGLHRAERRELHPWLGAGAVTLGIGAALATGSGVAYADDSAGAGNDGPSNSAPASSKSSDDGTSGRDHTAPTSTVSGGTKDTDTKDTDTKDTGVKDSGAKDVKDSANAKDSKHADKGTDAEDVKPAAKDATSPAAAVEKKLTVARHLAPRPISSTSTPSADPGAPTADDTAPQIQSLALRTVDTPSPNAATPLVAPNPVAPPQDLFQLVVLNIVQSIQTGFGLFPPTGTSTGVPAVGDSTQTPYGTIGKWMIDPDGDVADWGGQLYAGRGLLEPINVIIVDKTSTTPEQAKQKLDASMNRSGFPAQPIHSTGFEGAIDGTTYGQQPDGAQEAYADNLFVLPNDHARMFGPAPASAEDGTGYVWSGSASTELPGIYNGQLAHIYASFNLARDILVVRLLLSGSATFVGIVPMGNQYNNSSRITGDHDGYAVVVQLTD